MLTPRSEQKWRKLRHRPSKSLIPQFVHFRPLIVLIFGFYFYSKLDHIIFSTMTHGVFCSDHVNLIKSNDIAYSGTSRKLFLLFSWIRSLWSTLSNQLKLQFHIVYITVTSLSLHKLYIILTLHNKNNTIWLGLCKLQNEMLKEGENGMVYIRRKYSHKI